MGYDATTIDNGRNWQQTCWDELINDAAIEIYDRHLKPLDAGKQNEVVFQLGELNADYWSDRKGGSCLSIAAQINVYLLAWQDSMNMRTGVIGRLEELIGVKKSNE